MEKPVSLIIGVASGRDPKWPFPVCLARLFAHCAYQLPTGSKLDINVISGFDTAQCRRKIAAQALERGDTHILFIDDDMEFPYDAAVKLIAHDKDIVAANYTSRVFPVVPLAYRDNGRIHSMYRSGLECVDYAPAGLMLIKTSVFGKIAKPWFLAPTKADGDEGISDDVYFCRKCNAAGIGTWIDHDLSQQIAHIGSFAFTHVHTNPDDNRDILDLCEEFL